MKKMTFRFLIFFLLTALFLYEGRPVAAGAAMSPLPQTALRPITAAGVSAFVEQYAAGRMGKAHAPGLVVTVVHGDEIILAQGYGLADLETGRPMTAQTNLRAGSVSKPVTSAAVLQLAAQGEIALSAPVSDYLPDLLPADRYGPAGTVAQFLTLQGGYADVVVRSHAPTPAEWQPLPVYLAENLPARVMPPGKVHSYNSWEHALLGQTLAEVTGKRFEQAMADLLFRPLAMAQTTFAQPLPAPIAANLATGYAFDGGYEEVPLDYVNLSPGIAMVTTGADMGRFMLALLNDGVLDGEQILAPSTVAGMLHRREVVHPRSRSRTYGFSEITLGGRQVIYHDGNGIGHGSRVILAPEHDLGIFLSVNHRPLAADVSSTPAYTFMKELGTALLQLYLPASTGEHEAAPPLPDAAERAARYAGHYRLAGTSQDDFFKLGALLDNVAVTAHGDGAISIGSNRYVEVEPLLFQSKTDPDFFVVFVENEIGEVKWLTFGGTGSYQKVTWYETPRFQLSLIATILLLSLIFLVVMPFSGHRYWTVWLMSLLNVAFLAGLAYMMSSADLLRFFKTIPPATKLLFLLPWLSGALALTLPIVFAALWRKRAALWARLLYGANTAATAGFLWFVAYWKLYLG